ncbi:leucyl/phenylalanyl-tRNA--protein transferase [Desulfovibrio sp. OttesenSCG-928-C06]|nr:leucyl/phenylalanyl-tRNA--protein transferase [Desulfovibrio sp. OttesenSCG-928-C06]
MVKKLQRRNLFPDAMPIIWLDENSIEFPPVRLADPEGLLAAGGDLSVARLTEAYRNGIFPWYGPDTPILWWSTNPRCVLFPEKLHVPASLKKIIRSQKFSFSVNKCFAKVMLHCAAAKRPDQQGTWITQDMFEAYVAMHRAGKAHSVEVWQDGKLAGGLYGVAIGRAFFGESMFYLRPDASKAAIAWLVPRLGELGFPLIDCQQETPHMMRFGAELVDRALFLKIISSAVDREDAVDFWHSQVQLVQPL